MVQHQAQFAEVELFHRFTLKNNLQDSADSPRDSAALAHSPGVVFHSSKASSQISLVLTELSKPDCGTSGADAFELHHQQHI